MKRHFKKHAGGLYPAGGPEEKYMTSIKEGDIVEVEVVRPRSQGRIRFWWSLVGFLVEQISSDEWTKDTTAEMLKILCGHFTLIVSPSGEQFRIPKSIAFHKISEDEFGELTAKALRVAATILQRFGQENWTAAEVERCRVEFENRWG